MAMEGKNTSGLSFERAISAIRVERWATQRCVVERGGLTWTKCSHSQLHTHFVDYTVAIHDVQAICLCCTKMNRLLSGCTACSASPQLTLGFVLEASRPNYAFRMLLHSGHIHCTSHICADQDHHPRCSRSFFTFHFPLLQAQVSSSWVDPWSGLEEAVIRS
jgi:hypothetical protein